MLTINLSMSTLTRIMMMMSIVVTRVPLAMLLPTTMTTKVTLRRPRPVVRRMAARAKMMMMTHLKAVRIVKPSSILSASRSGSMAARMLSVGAC